MKLPRIETIKNLTDLESFAKKLVKFLNRQPRPYYVLLVGDLGVGKTTLTQILIHAFGIKERVTSPTFVILNQYHTPRHQTINHMDAYRLSKNEDLAMYEELFENSLNIIEWPEKLNLDWSKLPHIKISMKQINDSARLIEME